MATRTEILRDVMQLAWTMARQDQWSWRAKSARPYFAAALKRAWDSIKTRLANQARRAATVPAMTAEQARIAILTIECKDRLSWADMAELDGLRAQLNAA